MRNAGWTVFITRCLMGVLGGLVILVAGLELSPYHNFLFWDISGQILGAMIPLGLGYVFARSWEEVAGIFGAFSTLVLALMVVMFLFTMLVRKIHQRKRARHATTIQAVENEKLQSLS